MTDRDRKIHQKDDLTTSLNVDKDIFEMYNITEILKRNTHRLQLLLNKNTKHFTEYKELNKYLDNMLDGLYSFIKKTKYE